MTAALNLFAASFLIGLGLLILFTAPFNRHPFDFVMMLVGAL